MRPSISGNATFIARSRGCRPRRSGAPAFLVAAGEDDLQHRAVGGGQRIVAGTCPDGKTSGVEDHRGRIGAEHRAEQRRGLAVFEALHEDRQRAQPPCRQRAHQRIDRRRVTGLNQRAVEHDRHDAAGPAPIGGDVVEARQCAIGPIETGAQQWRGLGPSRWMPDQRGGVAQQILGVGWAALGEIAPQPEGAVGRQGRQVGQFRIGLVVAGQQRQRDTIGAAGLDQALDPVGPIGAAAEHPRNHQARAGDRLHVEVDREIMAEAQDRREAQARRGRVLGASPRRAAASNANSVSALDSTTMSPGVWARSTAAEPSAITPGKVARRCIQLRQRRGDGRSARPFSPITTSRVSRRSSRSATADRNTAATGRRPPGRRAAGRGRADRQSL